MSTQAGTVRPPLGSESRARLLVGVDDTDQDSGPMPWACQEADRQHVSLQVIAGTSARVLMDAIDENTVMLVVGRRTHAAVQHLVLGSTSQVVAGRASVPVVVIPDCWTAVQPTSAPLVIGVSGHDHDEPVLRFAFERAAALGVPLVVVHGWEISPLLSWSPDDLDEGRTRVTVGMERLIGPWRARYPRLEVVVLETPVERPVDAVLDAGRVSQLMVIGRHGKRRVHLGSTARGVLHRAEVPVAVVPVEPVSTTHPRSSTHVGSGVWRPTY